MIAVSGTWGAPAHVMSHSRRSWPVGGVGKPRGVGTPKGERRRDALTAAAAELLGSGGFDAVRHRAVAEKAGLPLASTTYYFGSLDELVTVAVERHGRDGLAEGRLRLA